MNGRNGENEPSASVSNSLQLEQLDRALFFPRRPLLARSVMPIGKLSVLVSLFRLRAGSSRLGVTFTINRYAMKLLGESRGAPQRFGHASRGGNAIGIFLPIAHQVSFNEFQCNV